MLISKIRGLGLGRVTPSELKGETYCSCVMEYTCFRTRDELVVVFVHDNRDKGD